MSEDFIEGWSGGSSVIAPPLSLLAPRSSGKNKAIGTLLKMAQKNQLPVRPRPRSEEMKNKRSETQPRAEPSLNDTSTRLFPCNSLIGRVHRLYI